MIRRIVFATVVAAAVVGASSASAQTIGFKVGPSFANWNMEEDGAELEGSTLTSFMGGGFIRFNMGRLGIQPELLYVTRGTEFEDETGEFGGTVKTKVDYIEIPVLLVLPLTVGTGISPYIFGGPSFAFEVGCKLEVDGGEFDGSVDCDEDGEDSGRKSLDLGATAGLGLTFPMGPGALLIEGRYNFGLSNISDIDNVDIKSRTAAILAGYQIWLGTR
jgi:hypothetical protein